MPETVALENARSLLMYWEKGHQKASQANDADQIARCDDFMQQCQRIIASPGARG